MHPRDLSSRIPDLNVKELELTSFAGQPLYAAHLGDGTTKLIALDGEFVEGFDGEKIVGIVKASAANPEAVEMRIVNRYDYHYLDRTRRRPLPVILALMHDENQTRYSSIRRWRRSPVLERRNGAPLLLQRPALAVSPLYNYRPLWDIVVIAYFWSGAAQERHARWFRAERELAEAVAEAITSRFADARAHHEAGVR